MNLSQYGSSPELEEIDPRLLLLDEADNVFIARRRINAGEPLTLGGAPLEVPHDIPLGHKVARRAILAGEKIMKYGVPIGTATVPIPMGCHVHVANVRSDYTPTYHLLDLEAGS